MNEFDFEKFWSLGIEEQIAYASAYVRSTTLKEWEVLAENEDFVAWLKANKDKYL